MRMPRLPLGTLIASAVCTLWLAASAHAQTTVILVRHAELQGEAMADPKPLPLSADGEARAQRLAEMLQGAGVSAIYVTDYLRTQATAQPLARALKLQPTVLPKSDMAALTGRLRQDDSPQTVLVVGHKDTLPVVLKTLGDAAERQIDAGDYGGLYVVTPRKGETPAVLRLRY